MKKSTLAVATLAVLATITTGGAWYTGNQIEQRYPELLTQANSILANLKTEGFEATISEVKLNKGLFSSDVQYQISITDQDKHYALEGNDKIYHGPLPLNRLMRGNLMPLLLSSETHISAVNELAKNTFTQQEAFSATTNVSYTNQVSGNATLNPINNENIKTSAIHFEGDYATTGKQKITADSIQLKDKLGKTIEIGGLNYVATSEQDKQYPDINGLGSYQLNIDKLVFIDEKEQSLVLNKLASKADGKINQQRVTSVLDLAVDINLNIANQSANFGQFSTKITTDLNAKATNNFAQTLKAPEKAKSDDVLLAVLTETPMFKIQHFSLENAKGKNNIALDLNLNKFDVAQLSQAKSISDSLKIFKPSNLNVNLDLASTEELIKQLLMISPEQTVGTPDENAQILIQNLSNSARRSKMAVVDEKSIKMDLKIENGKMVLNGREISEMELQMALLAIMLGVGDIGH